MGSGCIPRLGLAVTAERWKVVLWFMTFGSGDEEGRGRAGGYNIAVGVVVGKRVDKFSETPTSISCPLCLNSFGKL